MKDCRDYVIVDGQFVGRFEDMYRDCEDPWEQSQVAVSSMHESAIALMRDRGVTSVIEYGCGLGYYTEILAAAGFQVTGLDVSETAIARARARRPDLSFDVHDMSAGLYKASADAILFASVTWYVLPLLDGLWREMRTEQRSRYFVQVLNFYPPDVQRYGRDYFTTFDEYVKRCPLSLQGSSVDGLNTSAIWTIT